MLCREPYTIAEAGAGRVAARPCSLMGAPPRGVGAALETRCPLESGGCYDNPIASEAEARRVISRLSNLCAIHHF